MASAAVSTPVVEAPARGGHVEALLREVLAEQAQQRATLAAILALLERGRGARDAAGVALLLTIAEVIRDRAWTSAQLIAHAEASPALRDALEAADVATPRELGWRVRRMEGSPRPGLWLERVGESRDGIVWRVRVSDSQPRAE